MTCAAVVFDLDYTLVVPDRDRQTLLDEATDSAGVRRIDRSEYLATHGNALAQETRTPIFASILDDGDPAVVADAYRRTIEAALVPVDGAPALLAELGRSYRLGCLTDGPARAQHGKLEALGWADRFDAVVVSGELGTSKPDKQTFRQILADLDVAAEQAVFVGDHPEHDIAGAAEAGFRVVQVLGDRFDASPAADATVDRANLARTLPATIEELCGADTS